MPCCLLWHRFETERTLQLVPPDGEFAVMNYRSTYPFKPPFRVTCTVDDDPNSAVKVPPGACPVLAPREGGRGCVICDACMEVDRHMASFGSPRGMTWLCVS